jgi:hypothetical protein
MSSLPSPTGVFKESSTNDSLPIFVFSPSSCSIEERVHLESLRQLIKRHGGILTSVISQGCIPIISSTYPPSLPPSSFVGLSFVYSDRWVYDSIRRRCIQNLDSYKLAIIINQQNIVKFNQMQVDQPQDNQEMMEQSHSTMNSSLRPVVASPVSASAPLVVSFTAKSSSVFIPSSTPSKSSVLHVPNTPLSLSSSALPHSVVSSSSPSSVSFLSPSQKENFVKDKQNKQTNKRKFNESTIQNNPRVISSVENSPASRSSSSPIQLSSLPPPPSSTEIRQNVLALQQMTGQPLDVVLHALMALNGNFSAAWDYLTSNEHPQDEKPWNPEGKISFLYIIIHRLVLTFLVLYCLLFRGLCPSIWYRS